MITVNEAIQNIMENCPQPTRQTVPVMNSIGCVLAENVTSDINMPPFNKSAMDGYAVIASDTQDSNNKLEIIEEIPAGTVPQKSLLPGKISKIMTGAPTPENATAVLMKEYAQVEQDETGTFVLPEKPVSDNENICKLGEDMKIGDIVLKENQIIRPQEIGVLATVGKHKIDVYKKPVVSVITTGSELVEISETPGVGKIRNSNAYTLSAQLTELNIPYAYLGIVHDSSEMLKAKIKEGLEGDVLILTGGVSVGDYDLVEDILKELGVEIIFSKVAVKPGKPVVFGKKGNKLVFGLPGNPVSAFVAFELFVRTALVNMMNRPELVRQTVECELATPYNKIRSRQQYVPSQIKKEGGKYILSIVNWHGSADILSYTYANSLLIVYPQTGPLNEGAIVNAVKLF